MKTIKDIMTSSPKTCKKTDGVQTVAKQMASSNVGSMPVVDENSKIVGMITDRDIALSIGKNDKSINDLKVSDVMTSSVETISAESDATEALKLMRTKKIGRLPVVDSEKRVKGIITLNGIVRGVRDASDKEEIGFKGKENVISTLQAIAERNELESVDEFGEE